MARVGPIWPIHWACIAWRLVNGPRITAAAAADIEGLLCMRCAMMESCCGVASLRGARRRGALAH